MTPEAWRSAALVVFLVAVAALLSAVRLTLARASRPAPTEERHAAPPRRARVLGALLVGSMGLNATAVSIATVAFVTLRGPNGAAYAAVALTVMIVLAEALARAGVEHGVIAGALRPFGLRIERYAEKLSAADSIRDRVDLLHQSGSVVKEERDMLGGLLDLNELAVSDVMVHRTRMRSVDANLPPADLVRAVLGSPHTRLPLWRDEPDNIVGVLHAKDLLRAMAANGGGAVLDIDRIATPPWFVPDRTTLRAQLAAFLARKQHVALVVDEYGDLMGLLTLEDILEEIVGEIADEHDVAVRGIRPQPDGSILADGSVPIRDLNRTMDWALPDDEATTVAGLVIHEAQAIPEPGQVYNFHGFRFEILRRSRNRITALRLGRVAARPVPEGSEGAVAPWKAEERLRS